MKSSRAKQTLTTMTTTSYEKLSSPTKGQFITHYRTFGSIRRPQHNRRHMRGCPTFLLSAIHDSMVAQPSPQIFSLPTSQITSPPLLMITSRKPVRCMKNKLKLNLKNYWSNYDFYCLLYFI